MVLAHVMTSGSMDGALSGALCSAQSLLKILSEKKKNSLSLPPPSAIPSSALSPSLSFLKEKKKEEKLEATKI